MSNDNRYSGWKNRATWTTNLWLDEDKQYHSENWNIDGLLERVNDGEDRFGVMRELSKTIQESVEEMIDDTLESKNIQASLLADLLHGAIAQVDFDEIADHWLEN